MISRKKIFYPFNGYQCQHCNKQIGIYLKGKASNLQNYFGLAQCECRHYLVVDGIIIFRPLSRLQEKLCLIFIKWRLNWLAQFCLINPGGIPLGTVFSIWLVNTYPQTRLIINLVPNFMHVRWKNAHAYLADRKKRVSYLLYLPLVKSLKFEGNILDACGGLGAWTELLSKEKVSKRIYLFDYSFWQVYLAKKIISPAKQICFAVVDANKPLPYQSGFFNGIIANDCLMYIRKQESFAKELVRISKPRTRTILLGHIHKKKGLNLAQGKGLDPKLLKQWLNPLQPLVIGEEQLMLAFLRGETLARKQSTISPRRAFALIIGKKKTKLLEPKLTFVNYFLECLHRDPEDHYLLDNIPNNP